MKLCRFGELGHERPGIVDSDGRIRDLSKHIPDITPEVLSPNSIESLFKVNVDDLPIVDGAVRYGVPIKNPSKFIAIGLNYRDHAEEADLPIPSEPVVFSKALSCLSGPNDNIVRPPHATKLDWELELGVVIGRQARYVSDSVALDHVAGYVIVNDITDRGFQFQSSQWDKGKGCDTFGPVGPWLVTKDEIPDSQNLDMWLAVNGERRQSGSSKTMIFTVAQIVAYLIHYMTLQPGDIICTGTPPGVGLGIKPTPVFLNDGDVIQLSIAGLGEQQQRVVRYGN